MGAMRNCLKIPAQRKKARNDLLAKPTNNLSETALCEFAALAYRLGFKSDQIHSLIQRSADREIARMALREARKPGRWRYNPVAFKGFVERMVNFFSTT
jgi:hypothetical protein